MNEKGFATILGLCLILALALVVKGIQESEGNHANETADFQAEIDLQSAAEFGIYKVAAYVKENPLPLNDVYEQSRIRRQEIQERGKVINGESIETSSGSVSVDVWAERLIITPYEVDYTADTDVANHVKEGNDKISDYNFAEGDELQILGGTFKKSSFSAKSGNLTLTINGGGKIIFEDVALNDQIKINGSTYTVGQKQLTK